MTDTTKVMKSNNYILDEQIGFALRLASQRHTAIFQNQTMLDLTPTQFSTLIRLAEVGSCSQNKLGRLTAMDAATIKGVIDRLHKKKLVIVTPDESDKRRMLVSLDDNAKAMIDDLEKVGTKISAETLKPLSSKQRSQLLKLLQMIS